MLRSVFIIKGFSKDEKELAADRYFADQYQKYFNSIAGGAYEQEEIYYCEDISANDLYKTLNNTNLYYCIIVLIGHGASQKNKQLFQLNENEIILAGQIDLEISKQLVIIESCRSNIDNIYTVDLNNKIPKFADGGLVRRPIDRQQARNLYDQYVEQTKNGNAICFACSENETAKNYYFSSSLLQTAFNWHLENAHPLEAMGIAELVEGISTIVNDKAVEVTGETQQPQVVGNTDFPFVISKFT